MAVSITQNYGSNNDPANAPFSGPLASLYNNRYAYQALQYPRDLGSTYKGHIVRFDVYEVNPVTLQEISDYVVGKYNENSQALGERVAQLENAASSAAQNPGAVVDYALQAAKDKFNETKNLYNQLTSGGLSGATSQIGQSITDNLPKLISGEYTTANLQIQPRNQRISKSISLYMPDTVDFSYTSSYTDLNLADAAGSIPLVGGIAKAITSNAGQDGNALIRLGLNAAGYVFNPQQQLLFQGIDFRTYQMAFTFTPSSAQEAENVKNIIQTFRQYAAPTIVRGLAGFFFNPPGMFDVSFLYNGQQNDKLNKIKKSVIENVEVNYAPNGWAAHEDGAPVQTTLTLSFKEMSLTDSADIKQGY